MSCIGGPLPATWGAHFRSGRRLGCRSGPRGEEEEEEEEEAEEEEEGDTKASSAMDGTRMSTRYQPVHAEL